MADAIEMPDDRDARFLLHAPHQPLAATRHDDIDHASRREQRTDHGAITRGHQLHCGLWQASFHQPLHQTCMQRAGGIQALTAPAQDGGIAALQTQSAGVHRHVRTAFVNDGDDTQRHAHALEMQAVRTGPFSGHGAHRVRQGRHLLKPVCNAFQPLRIQCQTVEHGRGQTGDPGGLQIHFVRRQNAGSTRTHGSGSSQQGVVLLFGRRSGQRGQRGAGRGPHLGHQSCGIRHRISSCNDGRRRRAACARSIHCHRHAPLPRAAGTSMTRSSRWTNSSRPRKPTRLSMSALLRPRIRKESAAE